MWTHCNKELVRLLGTMNKPNLEIDEQALLETITDDYYGLWEIPVEFFRSAIPEFHVRCRFNQS